MQLLSNDHGTSGFLLLTCHWREILSCQLLRRAACVFVSLSCACYIYPFGVGIDPSAFRASLWADVFPTLGLTNKTVQHDSYKSNAKDFTDYTDQSPFASLGFSIDRNFLSIDILFELQRDYGQWLKGIERSNLPVVNGGFKPSMGTIYPQVGYIEGEKRGILFSAGRRKIAVGPSIDASLGVSDRNPWYDHVLAGLEVPFLNGKIEYDCLAIGVRRVGMDASNSNRSEDPGKMLLLHRLAYSSDQFSLGIGEYNLIANVTPDMEDLNPFLISHHLFATGSNVMLGIDVNWSPEEDFRAYSELLIDDVQLAEEESDSNPTAIGFSTGMEWRIKQSVQQSRPKFFHKDYGMRLGHTPLSGGTILRFESALASTYLYRRNELYPSLTMTTRYYARTASEFRSMTIDSFFAHPLGPDRLFFSLTCLSDGYADRNEIKISCTVLGAESDTYLYSSPYRTSWIGPQIPVRIAIGQMYSYMRYIGVNDSVTFRETIDLTGKEEVNISVSVGFAHRFAAGISPRTK